MLYNTTPDQLYEHRAIVDPLGYGRVAIVTGCASGIGLACTQLLLAHQFSVCGLDRQPFDYATYLRPDGQDHGRFHFHQCDLTTPGACDDAVRICRLWWGRQHQHQNQSSYSDRPPIDVLINAAGVLLDGFASADTVSDAVWDEVLAVNLTVPVRMMRAVLAPIVTMIDFAPSPSSSLSYPIAIVNVASTAGISGAVAGIAYTASKHGLIGATKNVAWRFRQHGIRCNAVLPGAVDSSIGQAIVGHVDSGFDSAAFAEVAPVHALQARRPFETESQDIEANATSCSTSTAATPAASARPAFVSDITALDVAKAIVFLLSDQARSINGVCLPVDKAWGVM